MDKYIDSRFVVLNGSKCINDELDIVYVIYL